MAGEVPALVYHLALAGEWQDAVAGGGPYRRSTIGRSLDEVGFVHLALARQVDAVADASYRGRDDVVLLTVAVARLPDEVRVESVPGTGDAFPHLYGPLPLDAVVAVEPLASGRRRAASGAGQVGVDQDQGDGVVDEPGPA